MSNLQRQSSVGLYRCTWAEKIGSFLRGVIQRVSPRPTLIVGPYAGEFGHEIMDFQSYVRWNARRYREVHVITYPGREPLYFAPNVTVHTHDFDLKTAGYFYGQRTFGELDEYARIFAAEHGLKTYDIFNTNLLCTRWHRKLLWPQCHEVLGQRTEEPQSRNLVFHFRFINKTGPDDSRNFKPELAQKLIQLCLTKGFHCTCIGHPIYSLCPDGCEDARTEQLEQTVQVIRSCRLVVGELSGPMHLAVYCAKPILTWAPEYKRIWAARRRNPFHVDIGVVSDETTNPDPMQIAQAINNKLSGDL